MFLKSRILCLAAYLFFPYGSWADCDLKVATAAGQYIAELERANLQKYQNSSVCEVLDYEFRNCSKDQKAKIEKVVSVKDLLGNACQPHLAAPKKNLTKDHLMKGADLYSWKEQNGYYWYALLPGTNRMKEINELTESRVNEGQLKELLANLKSDTDVTWNGVLQVKGNKNLNFSLPPDKNLQEIKDTASQAKLNLEISSSR